MKRYKPMNVDSFDFWEGRILAGKYEVISKLGEGWEGEVYLVKEVATGIDRAAKFFYPQRNVGNKNLNNYAMKLNKLRTCSALIQYHTQDKIRYKGTKLSFLVSDYIEGEILEQYLKRLPGKRLDYFQGLHLLRSLVVAVDEIHRLREYHGDLHTENVMVNRVGLGFDVKLIDFYPAKLSKHDAMRSDICDVIKIFYDSIGGRKHYAKLPIEVKRICCGLKGSLILKKFRTIDMLLKHLDQIKWGES